MTGLSVLCERPLALAIGMKASCGLEQPSTSSSVCFRATLELSVQFFSLNLRTMCCILSRSFCGLFILIGAASSLEGLKLSNSCLRSLGTIDFCFLLCFVWLFCKQCGTVGIDESITEFQGDGLSRVGSLLFRELDETPLPLLAGREVGGGCFGKWAVGAAFLFFFDSSSLIFRYVCSLTEFAYVLGCVFKFIHLSADVETLASELPEDPPTIFIHF